MLRSVTQLVAARLSRPTFALAPTGSRSRQIPGIGAYAPFHLARYTSTLPNNKDSVGRILLSSEPVKFERQMGEDVINAFNKDVFSRSVLRSYLTEKYYNEYLECIDSYKELSPELADMIAHAMKEWALSKGATHFTHWFQPMTGATAEKHDSFLDWSAGEQRFVANFTGKRLIKGESDASSFPSGGVRQTFEARGYTIWDLSPPFIKHGINGSTLYIPTAFASWKGDALDTKTPLLRSEKVLSDASVKLIKLISPSTPVISTQSEAGAEQEFFLIDRQHFHQRPDLLFAGRTTMGAKMLQEQQHGYHYFGTTPPRVLAFMQEAEIELSKAGIPMLARHNEVAPGQFEMAPLFERSPVAADHNMLMMDILLTVANRHGFECLLHEKPFAGVNGSGKHINYSISTNYGENMFKPGDTPQRNSRFLVFLAAVIRGVHLYGDLVRALTAVPGNDFRLGSHEAPPAVVSVYLGDEVDNLCQWLMGNIEAVEKREETLKFLGTLIPALKKDTADRNRTSPFAFTGNRFEFRAIGSSQSVAIPILVLNAIIADSVEYMTKEIQTALKKRPSDDRDVVIAKVVGETLKKHYNIVYNGDNYTEEYLKEAEMRGLPHLRTAPEALAAWDDPKNIDLLARMGVLTRTEQEARSKIVRGNFLGQILTECNAQQHMAKCHVLPSALAHLKVVSESLNAANEALRGNYEELQNEIIKTRDSIKALYKSTDRMEKLLKEETGFEGTIQEKFAKYHPLLSAAMAETRRHCDLLEELVDAKLWTLPRYSDMLYF